MKFKHFHPALLLVYGWLTGILSALIFLPNLSVPPDVWGSILGSSIGVLGAFFAARLTFQWQEAAAHSKALRPFLERYSLGMHIAPIALRNLNIIQPDFEKLGKRLTISNAMRPINRFPESDTSLTSQELELRKRIHDDNVELQKQFDLIDISLAHQVNEQIMEIASHFGWLRENFQATLTPDQLRLVIAIHANAESATASLTQSIGSIQNSFIYIREEKFREGEERLNLIDNSQAALRKMNNIFNYLHNLKALI